MANQDLWTNNLEKYRKASKKKLSQADLAQAIGLKAQTTISAIEKGALSGRKYWDKIAEVLEVPTKDIFPFYGLLTYDEAGKIAGVSSTLIHRRVLSKELVGHKVKGLRLVEEEQVRKSPLKRREGPSIREQLVSLLGSSDNGLTTSELVDAVNSALASQTGQEQDVDKIKRTIQTLLSRGEEFVVDKNPSPPIWKHENVSNVRAETTS